MGLISRVSSRTYRELKTHNQPKLLTKKQTFRTLKTSLHKNMSKEQEANIFTKNGQSTTTSESQPPSLGYCSAEPKNLPADKQMDQCEIDKLAFERLSGD